LVKFYVPMAALRTNPPFAAIAPKSALNC
jgi:hypothetical protein